MVAEYDAKNRQALIRLKAAGVQLHKFSDDIMEGSYKAATEMYDEEAAKNAKFKKIYDEWKKFRAEEAHWFALSELAMDAVPVVEAAKTSIAAHPGSMRRLLAFTDAVDWLTEQIGQWLKWLVLFSSLISAFNALMRYTIHYSSNAWLEIQWYMFGAMFLLAAGYALKHEEHVRVDVFFSKMTPEQQAWLDVFGGILFLMPMAVIIAWLSIPMVVNSYQDLGALVRSRRSAALADQDHDPDRLRSARRAGRGRDHQEVRGRHRRARAGQSLRAAGAMMLSFEVMAPLMFAGLIVFLLIGYPVAFSLSAVGLGFGFLAI